ncbi:MAG: HAMP domain-containing histidine kinase [Saccharofermentans sp.]|nr:HAMP domain-containing histidine kinase [Saccharofermentans sp.]
MKFFTKLYLVILILLTATLAFTEYFIINISLKSALNTQVDTSLKQHQLIKYAIQSDMLSALQTGNENVIEVATEVAYSTANTMATDIMLLQDDEQMIYRTASVAHPIPEDGVNKNQITYITVYDNGRYYLEMNSILNQAGLSCRIVTLTDITYIYDNVQTMSRQCAIVFLIIVLVGAIIAVVFSNFITLPIKKLTKIGEEFSNGDYSGRVNITSKDEIGELGSVYNKMADSIEDKIAQLELAVKQREDFTAAFAHELKTPMTSIIGYADTLYQKDLSEDEARNAAGFIVNEGMRLESLSFKLLELMTLSKNDFLLEEVQMADFIKDINDTVKPAAQKKNVRLFFDYEEGYCKIEIDLFKTLILNLIDNAMKSGSPDVAVLSQSQGNKYMIAIVDHGRGIPAAELKRVTEAFYMVDKARSRQQHGAGLGLALCEKIAELHGSKLDIRSVEGEGTAIRITLEKLEAEDDEE